MSEKAQRRRRSSGRVMKKKKKKKNSKRTKKGGVGKQRVYYDVYSTLGAILIGSGSFLKKTVWFAIFFFIFIFYLMGF